MSFEDAQSVLEALVHSQAISSHAADHARRVGAARGAPAAPDRVGGMLTADPTTDLGGSLWNTGIYEIAVSEVMARLIEPGDTVIDAGANIGYMTLLAAVLAGPGGRVIAFEPHPALFERLRSNIQAAGETLRIAPVDLRNAALGEQPGTADLIVPEEFASNEGLSHLGASEDDSPGAQDSGAGGDARLGAGVGLGRRDEDGCGGFRTPGSPGASGMLAERRIRHILFEDHVGFGSETMEILRGWGMEIFAVGWTVGGVRLASPEAASAAKSYEAPNYLATFSPAEARNRCSPGGWRVLDPRLTQRNRPSAEAT